MKLRRTLFFFLLFFNNPFCFSQTWAPVGATWYYNVNILFMPYVSYVKFQSVGDTLINGKTCSIIKYVDGHLTYCLLPGDLHEVYSYSDSGKVYVYDSTNSGFSLVYDFSLDTGQTYTSVWDSCSYQRTISYTDSINLNGNWHKRYRLMETGLSSYIENIGGADIFLPCLYEVSCTGLIVDADYISGLRCYYDSITGFIDFDTAHACDYITGIQELNTENLFSVSPNPVQDFIHVENPFSTSLSVTVFSSYGTLVHQVTLAKDADAIIDLSTWADGIYLVTAQSGKNFISRKIVKQ